MDEIMVSVCVMAYNHEKYIRDALEGIVNQKTNFKFEVLVHDDASVDETPHIIEEYSRKYPNLIKSILQEENQCSKREADLREYVFSYIRGKYIAVCEGDDFWTDYSKLQRQVDFLEKNTEFIACAHNTLQWDVITQEKRVMYSKDQDRVVEFKELLKGGGGYQTAALMYPYSLLKQYIAEKPEFAKNMWKKGIGDLPWNIFLGMHGKVYCFKDIMSVYRFRSEGSWSSKYQVGDKQRGAEHWNAKRQMYRELLTETPKRLRKPVLQEYSEYEKGNIVALAEKQDKQGVRAKMEIVRCYPFYWQAYIIIRTYFNGIYMLYRKLRYKE